MIGDKEQTIAQLLEESQAMVQRFEGLKGRIQVEEISADVQKQTFEEFEHALEPSVDGFFDLFVEDDSMTAVAEFRPPAGGGKPMDPDLIEAVLAKNEVNYGVLWEQIRQGLTACNLDRRFLSGVEVARGTAPVPFVPAHLRLEDRWTETKPQADDKAVVDFKTITPFVMVKKGDLIALRMPEVPGSAGTDIRGREVPFPTAKVPVWTPGPNLVETAVGFEAALDGRLVLTPPTFGVNPVLELKGGVDYHTGNIRFKGEVLVLGRVAAGFGIEAEGGLSCTAVLDAFDVKVGNDLVTPGGIIGNGPGRVEVGGQVKAKFLEHLYLLAQGDVRAESCVLNSVVKTRGKLVLGDKGILAGGQVHALDGGELFQIGTPTGPQTELFLGLDFLGMEHILWIRERTKELHAQLHKVDAAIAFGGHRVGELQEAAKKLRVEIVGLTETARTQLMNLGQNEGATLVVRGSVYPGTLVEICHMRFVVTQKLTAVKFSLDKRKGIVAVTPLGAEATTHSGSPLKKR